MLEGGTYLYPEDTGNLRRGGFRKTKPAGMSKEKGTLDNLGLEVDRSPGEDMTQVCNEDMKDHFLAFGLR